MKEFEAWWALYPRKVGKGAARAAWAKALRLAAPERLIQALREQVAAGVFGQEVQFVPHPRTWLTQERWEDEVVMRRVRTAADDLAARWVEACRKGSEAAKADVRAAARQRGLRWDEVMEARRALAEDQP